MDPSNQSPSGAPIFSTPSDGGGGANSHPNTTVSTVTSDLVLPQAQAANAKKKSKLPTIIVCILILIAVGVGVGLFFSYRNQVKEEAKSLYELLGWASHTSQCSSVTGQVDNEYVSEAEYELAISSCKEAGEKIKSYISHVSSLSNDSEYKLLYSALSSVVEETVVLGEDLDNALNIYKLWHRWILAIQSIDIYQIPKEIESTAKILSDSGNDALQKYATEWIAARQKLVDAYINVEAGISASNVYDEAKQAYDAATSNTPDLSVASGFNNNPSDEQKLHDALINYNKYIEERL